MVIGFVKQTHPGCIGQSEGISRHGLAEGKPGAQQRRRASQVTSFRIPALNWVFAAGAFAFQVGYKEECNRQDLI
jgi:hypothetical protein